MTRLASQTTDTGRYLTVIDHGDGMPAHQRYAYMSVGADGTWNGRAVSHPVFVRYYRSESEAMRVYYRAGERDAAEAGKAAAKAHQDGIAAAIHVLTGEHR